jgi:hypothetical protein
LLASTGTLNRLHCRQSLKGDRFEKISGFIARNNIGLNHIIILILDTRAFVTAYTSLTLLFGVIGLRTNEFCAATSSVTQLSKQNTSKKNNMLKTDFIDFIFKD